MKQTEDNLWRAVEQRDKATDGKFVYGVLTTGVYCRPSCSSRQPRRENVRFFATGQEAERAGLRACRKCRPNLALENGIVPRASRYIREHLDDKLDLATAERIVQSRQRAPLKSVGDLTALAPNVPPANLNRLAFNSNYFQVRGRLRLGDVVLEQHSLVKRNGPTVVVLQRERVSTREQTGS